MQSYGIVRPLDKLGHIVLPVDLYRSLLIHAGDSVEFFVDVESGTISVRKYRSTECLFCNSTRHLIFFKSYYVCHDCIDGCTDLFKDFIAKSIPIEDLEAQVQSLPLKKHASKSDALQRFLDLLQEYPTASPKELAQRLGVTQARISQLFKHANQLYSD